MTRVAYGGEPFSLESRPGGKSESGSMRNRTYFGAALALALALEVCGEAHAQAFATYVETSGSEQTPRGNAGVSVNRERLRLRADVALNGIAIESDPEDRLPGGSTQVIPNLRSSFVVAKNLDLETKVSFAEWNAGEDTTLDTRLRYRRSLGAFFNELDSSFWRAPDGLTKQVLRLGFRQLYGEGGDAPLAITGAAIFEAMQHPNTAVGPDDSRKVGVETKITGFMAPFTLANHGLSLKLEKTDGVHTESTGTLAYDQSWRLGPLAQLGFTLKFLRRTNGIVVDSEPSLDFSWRGRL